MDSFNIIVSPKALSQLNDYMQYTLLQAALMYDRMPWKQGISFQRLLAA